MHDAKQHAESQRDIEFPTSEMTTIVNLPPHLIHTLEKENSLIMILYKWSYIWKFSEADKLLKFEEFTKLGEKKIYYVFVASLQSTDKRLDLTINRKVKTL